VGHWGFVSSSILDEGRNWVVVIACIRLCVISLLLCYLLSSVGGYFICGPFVQLRYADTAEGYGLQFVVMSTDVSRCQQNQDDVFRLDLTTCVELESVDDEETVWNCQLANCLELANQALLVVLIFVCGGCLELEIHSQFRCADIGSSRYWDAHYSAVVHRRGECFCILRFIREDGWKAR